MSRCWMLGAAFAALCGCQSAELEPAVDAPEVNAAESQLSEPASPATVMTESRPAFNPNVPEDRRERPEYQMDYGPFLSGTIEADAPADNVALKAVAVPLGANGEAGMVFDTELLRMASGWVDGYLQLRGTPYDGSHGPIPKLAGTQVFGTGVRPGWVVVGEDGAGDLDDPRDIPHGPLPKSHGRYRGLYRDGAHVVFSYRVGDCDVLEMPGIAADGSALVRTIELAPHESTLDLLVAEAPGAGVQVGSWKFQATPDLTVSGEHALSVAVSGVMPAAQGNLSWRGLDREQQTVDITDGCVVLRCEPSATTQRFRVVLSKAPWSGELPAYPRLARHMRGGPARWTEPVVTKGTRAEDDAAYVVDTLTVPLENPWNSRMRIAGLDFFSDGRAAVSTWNGDVWTVDGIDDDLDELVWKRFATGLFDPLGLKIVGDVIHTLGRDQITRLHDLNGDGEADFYECFNNDVLITKNFHEFAFDLQTDAAGNFYFSKGGPVKPGGRGFDKIVPHHGCLLRVSPDGSSIDVVATGLRAPNGIGIGPNGEITSGDNEGTWMPRCRLNWIEPGTFCGCVDTAHHATPPKEYDLPLCWMPMEVDNSSGSQVWVTHDDWGPFAGQLLHLSYGTCSLYAVLKEEVDGVMQGGLARFPLSFASSCMRARFHPHDRQLYVCGLRGWQTRAAQLSALHRVRYTGQPANMPIGLSVKSDGVELTFTDALDPELARDPESYTIEQWDYVWSEKYGSPEVPVGQFDEDVEAAKGDWNGYKEHDEVTVEGVELSEDGRTVFLKLARVMPVMQMRIQYDLDSADGVGIRGEITNTIHRVPAANGSGGR